ncbi:MAG: hypothetical protein KA015_02065 [Spirochaetes bacterium]|nr:hypothetical protein [Spirochaetota bacterium]
MKKIIVITGFLLCFNTYSAGLGVRGAFTRNCFIGSEYIASGRSCESYTDDVYSVYWNPAGLVSLYNKKKLTADEIRKKADKGEIEDISEEDIRKMDDNSRKAFLQLGFTASNIDIDRRSLFAASAFKLFNGVMAIGAYVINSPDIEKRDEAGNLSGKTSYTATVTSVSYAFESKLANFGFTLKGLSENIAGDVYYGAAGDFGAQFYVLPILKIGVVAQDLGLFMYGGSIDGDKYDFGSPMIRGGLSFSNASRTVILSASTVRRLESDSFAFNIGFSYYMDSISFMTGLTDKCVTAGSVISISGKYEFSYAFSVDPVDLGYNNSISLSAVF